MYISIYKVKASLKKSFKIEYKRYIYSTIDFNDKMVGLFGARGVGKTTILFQYLQELEPFEVNYTKIAALAEISRVKLYDYLSFLNDGQMLLLVDENVDGLKKVQKAAKIYLNNTNLLFAYCGSCDAGTVRETFFANQVSHKYKLNISKQGDFLIDKKYTVEVGGKKKGYGQTSVPLEGIKDVPNSFIVSDDIEIGSGTKIPLWLFGFVY